MPATSLAGTAPDSSVSTASPIKQSIAQKYRALDYVLKLPDISRPGITSESSPASNRPPYDSIPVHEALQMIKTGATTLICPPTETIR